jgi:hypothetical protein
MSFITYRSPKTELTVADIFREHWAEYKKKYPVTPQQAKVVGSVLALRQAQDAPAGPQPWAAGSTSARRVGPGCFGSIAVETGTATNVRNMSGPSGWPSNR